MITHNPTFGENKRIQKMEEKEEKLVAKRRGRKRERDDLYFIKAQQRIKDLRFQLSTAKNDGLSVKER